MRFGRNAGQDVSVQTHDAAASPQEVVQSELQPREKLLWAARPASRRSHAYNKLLPALFGTAFLGFTLFWTWMAASMGGGGLDFFPLFGLPFILVGGGMMFSPLYAAWLAGRTVYALTDRRLIILRQGWRKSVRSWTLAQAGDLARFDNGDGTSNLFFATSSWRDSDGHHRTKRHGFLGIDDAANLEYQITQLRDSDSRSASNNRT